MFNMAVINLKTPLSFIKNRIKRRIPNQIFMAKKNLLLPISDVFTYCLLQYIYFKPPLLK